jgi:hypothetical protein
VKYLKIVGILFVIVVAVLCIGSFLSGYSLVITTSDKNDMVATKPAQKGQTLNVLNGLDLNQGAWKVYLVIDSDDWTRLPAEIPRRSCLVLSDLSTIKDMKTAWRFRISGGDTATVTSAIYFVRDGKVQWQSGIVLDQEREGLQSSALGWLEPLELGVIRQYAKYFRPVYLPFVILR